MIAVAGINMLSNEDAGVLGAGGRGGLPLAQFAVPDARSRPEGDANIAQDDCERSEIPCPEDGPPDPRLRGGGAGGDPGLRPLRPAAGALVLVHAGRRLRGPAGRLRGRLPALPRPGQLPRVDVRDDADEVRRLIAERGWTHPVGLDRDGALSNLYRIGGCPTFLYAYPGGILQATTIGELDQRQLSRGSRS